MSDYKNPVPTVDIIIEIPNSSKEQKQIVLINRKNPPFGWAIPGGFVDYGESLEQAAVREAKEETNLDITLKQQFHTYSDPSRDLRLQTISTVFIAEATGAPVGQDDALEAKIFNMDDLPKKIVFDHAKILQDYANMLY